jgi:hypothetical protein
MRNFYLLQFPALRADQMAVRFRNLAAKEWLRLFGPFLVSFVVGILLRFRYRLAWPPQDFVYTLADALVVAAIIGSLLELFAAKLLIQRVADELAAKLVGRGLPSELQSHIQQITKTAFVRENYVKSYSFSDPDENSRVRLEVTISFDVKNYSDMRQEFTPVAQEEVFLQPEFHYLEYGIVGQDSLSFDESQLKRIVHTDPLTSVKTITGPSKVTLDPIRDNGKSVCRVRWVLGATMPEEYWDTTNFGGATIGATLRLDKIPDTLEFRSSGENMKHSEGSRSWYFSGPFISGQHVNAWWFRK